jgi:uncharacterized membrane protein (UPF0127 family)
MKSVAIVNQSHPLAQPLAARYCVSFLCRLRGLTFRRTLARDQGLLLVQPRDSRMDSSIHMLMVFMDLAVVWINDIGEVVDVKLAHQWRPAYFPRRPARYVLEMHPARLADFSIGDKVSFEEF